MKLKIAIICLSVLWMGGLSAQNQLTIAPGTIRLAAETADQIVPVAVSGGGATAGMNLYLQVGGGTEGPVIAKADMVTGSIWGASAAQQVELGGSTSRTVFHATVTPAGTVIANGTVVTLTVDTTGVQSGEYPLTLNYQSFPTQVLDADGAPLSLTISDGILSVPYTLSYTAGAKGGISGKSMQYVHKGGTGSQVKAISTDPNYHFEKWSDDVMIAARTDSNVTENIAVTANFARNTAVLTVGKSGNGNARFTGANPLNTATVIPITATAYAKNHFVNWTLASGSGSATIADANSTVTTVTLTGGHGSTVMITANFAEDMLATTFPAIPVISATDGTYEDRVVVTWKAVSGATSYKIYRTTVNSTDGIEVDIPLGETADSIFEDTSAKFNIVYYYFAKATNSIGDSGYSAGNSGYVATPAVPGAVTASDGTYFDKIRVSWAKVVGATSYRVFRTGSATSVPDPTKDTNLIGETTALFLDDFGGKIVPPPEDVAKKYYYWIAAKNVNATTAISNFNSGYLSKKGPATVSASNGTY
jgi:hypothetical protein